MIQAFIIFSSLILGYFINLKCLSIKIMNKFLSFMIALIIAVMGYNFGELLYDLQDELLSMIIVIISFIFLLFVSNIASVCIYLKFFPHHDIKGEDNLISQNSLMPIFTSFIYLIYLIIGIILGIIINKPIFHIEFIVNTILVLILFVIGIQMRREGHSLTHIIKNRTGIIIAVIIIVSSLLVGIILSYVFNVSLSHSLMLISGFGWYSLASILNAQLVDAHFGTMTFFIDFSRELIAIILIPMLSKKIPIELISYSGATAMDFSLPVIKDHIGIQAVPIAISTGFVLTLATPILIPLFNLIPI